MGNDFMELVALPFHTFEEATTSVLKMLQKQTGMDLWMMTRTEAEDWIVLNAEDKSYDVHSGQIFRWSDSFCSRMVRGEGPRIAPDAKLVAAYQEAPIGRQVPIGAYVGVPLSLTTGELFGTLCAIDPRIQPDTLSGLLEHVELNARLLVTILEKELAQQKELRRAERAQIESETDYLTGLYNRRGWRRLCAAEQQRSERYGEPLGVIILDLDGLKWVNDNLGHDAGDRLIRDAAGIIRTATPSTSIPARLGGDEFGILLAGKAVHELDWIGQRVYEALTDANISASVGSARWQPTTDLCETEKLADQRMYQRKQEKSPVPHLQNRSYTN